MYSEAKSFLNAMEEKNINYHPMDETDSHYVVSVGFNWENTIVNARVFFDKDGHTVGLRCFGFVKVNEKQFPTALLCCNDFNKRMRWVKFVIDDDMEITLEDDAIVDEETAGEEVLELVLRMVTIADEIYPELNAKIWSV